MSAVKNSINSVSPPPEPWVGKSRNAKAQARHRAKRKAYIEQLEQTVSKLQTALALSAEDVADLPTAQMKLRELKEENDALRAELRKLQMQSSPSACSSPHSNQGRVPSQMLSPASSEEHLRPPKKRKGPEDAMADSHRFHHTDSRRALHVPVPPPMPPQQTDIHLQRQVTAIQPSDVPSVQQSRESIFSWRPYPEDPLVDTTLMSWSLPSQSSHYRQRSCSSESTASSDPLYLAQAHTPSVANPYKQGTLHNDGAPYSHILKPEENYSHNNTSETSAPYGLTQAIPLCDSTSQQNAWLNGAWPYSAVRMQ